MNENTVTKINHNEYKDVFLNNKYLRYSMNKIQRKNHIIGIYETNKISLSSFDGKIHVLNNEYDGFTLSYYS